MRWRASLAVAALAFAAGAARADEIGAASWYGDELRGRATASGEPFNPDAMTAAHPRLPIGSFVAVTALDTGRTVVLRVNDRGPYHGGRILDMSFGAARALGLTGHGARLVRVERHFPGDGRALREGRVSAVLATVPVSTLAAWRLRANWTAPAIPKTLVPPGSGPLWLQVASFSSPTRAQAMATRLGATISTVGGIHRVRIGPFARDRDAIAALAPLAAKGYPDVRIVR